MGNTQSTTQFKLLPKLKHIVWSIKASNTAKEYLLWKISAQIFTLITLGVSVQKTGLNYTANNANCIKYQTTEFKLLPNLNHAFWLI